MLPPQGKILDRCSRLRSRAHEEHAGERMSTYHVKVAIGMAVIVAAVAYLLLSGTTASTVYFLTVPEVQQQLLALQQAARPIRVAGPVTADPIYWEARHLSLAFRIGEGEAR